MIITVIEYVFVQCVYKVDEKPFILQAKKDVHDFLEGGPGILLTEWHSKECVQGISNRQGGFGNIN